MGLRAGLTKDIWTVVNPDLAPLGTDINRGNAVFAAALSKTMKTAPGLAAGQQQAAMNELWTLRDQAITVIANRYVTHPWPVEFLLIVDPLVSWIWIGAIIIAAGGLIALWPIPSFARRRVTVTARSRSSAPAVTAAREPA